MREYKAATRHSTSVLSRQESRPQVRRYFLPWCCSAEPVQCKHWPKGSLHSIPPFCFRTACLWEVHRHWSSPWGWRSHGVPRRPYEWALLSQQGSSDWSKMESKIRPIFTQLKKKKRFVTLNCTDSFLVKLSWKIQYFYRKDAFHCRLKKNLNKTGHGWRWRWMKMDVFCYIYSSIFQYKHFKVFVLKYININITKYSTFPIQSSIFIKHCPEHRHFSNTTPQPLYNSLLGV